MPPSVASPQLLKVHAHAIKEPLGNGPGTRFWTGVAQITRNRDRVAIASYCFCSLFSTGCIWRRIRHMRARSEALSLDCDGGFESNGTREVFCATEVPPKRLAEAGLGSEPAWITV